MYTAGSQANRTKRCNKRIFQASRMPVPVMTHQRIASDERGPSQAR